MAEKGAKGPLNTVVKTSSIPLILIRFLSRLMLNGLGSGENHHDWTYNHAG